MYQWIDLEIMNEDDLKKFISGYDETYEKYIIYITQAKNLKSKEKDLFKRFEDIMKIYLFHNAKIRLIVTNLCDKNVKLITKLSNIVNVEGIRIKKR